MAPEMINDEFYDMGIDIWSLGVLLYEMIHGYSPFRANRFIKDAKKAQVEIFINIKNNNYSINKNISKECIDLIDKLLTTDTAKRIKIDELFMHPWVVNKEKEYFPYYKRFKEIKTMSNNNISNSHRRLETDINHIKNLDINIGNGELLDNKYNKEKGIFENEKEKKIENVTSPKHNKNKSYCFVYTKGNSINNGIYFIQGKSGTNKNNREEKMLKTEKDGNNYEYNKIILTESNQDIIKKNNRNELSPIIQKKEADAKNNFVYSINSRRKKINLPRVIRTEKKEIENKILNLKPYESQEIKSINIKLNEKPKKQEENLGIRNFSKPKNDKKALIRVQRQELDDYLKGQNEINDLNIKMEKIKEKQELVINKLRKIEEKKRREESLQKLYDSQKSNTSYDYYIKSKKFKNQFLYMNYKSKKEIGSYSIKQFPRKREKENDTKNKILNLREKIKEKRSKSFQQLLTEKSLENKIRSILREKRSKNKTNINIVNNINKNYLCKNNEILNLRNIHNNKEDDINIKENFKRFRKMVVHLKKRNNLINKTEGNLNKSENKQMKSNYPKIYQKSSKGNKSIKNIFYNTFYNCLFNNEQNNNCANIKNLYMNNNKKKEFKSISSEKNIFKYKNLFELNSKNNFNTKKNEYAKNINLNKENELVNFSTERKRGNLFLSSIINNYEKKNLENKSNYAYINYKNNLVNSGLIHTPSNKKEIFI